MTDTPFSTLTTDPVTQPPINPTQDIDLSNYANFQALEERVLAPQIRTAQQGISPAAVKSSMQQNVWVAYNCQPHSKWQFTINGGGTTLRDGHSPTPGFAMGNAVIDAKYYKRGRFVFIKIRGALGTSTLWSNIQLQPDGVTQYGDFGSTYFNLPFPGAQNDFTFALGAMRETNSILDAGSNVVLRYSLASNSVAQLSNNLGIFSTNQFVRNGATEVMANFFASASAGPQTYNAAGPFQQFTTSHDQFDLQLKYETDVDS